MLSDHSINMSVDIALHVFILFTFLSIFFFAYVSKLEKQNVNDKFISLHDGNAFKTGLLNSNNIYRIPGEYPPTFKN